MHDIIDKKKKKKSKTDALTRPLQVITWLIWFKSDAFYVYVFTFSLYQRKSSELVSFNYIKCVLKRKRGQFKRINEVNIRVGKVFNLFNKGACFKVTHCQHGKLGNDRLSNHSAVLN